MDIVDARPRLTMFRFPIGQAYLWYDDDGLTLVDSGHAGAAPAVEKGIRAVGRDPALLRRIVLTHDLGFGDGAVVVHAPGHTDGSMGIHLPRHGGLFTGDAIAAVERRVILGVFNTDRARAKASMSRLAASAPETVCCGHGDPVTEDTAAVLRAAAKEAAAAE
ncbi:MBL fold metallo-hydrolase [Streptomyces sp. NPDC094448]|uniref:MBL fold metallo-hydrolase n=1 Tax=Streptomyces sp. NPDC094448 TaxID=3366063 RepID=UPI0038042D31